MEELIKLLNKVFDGNYFEVKSYTKPSYGEFEYCIDVSYIPDGTPVQKTKFYYKDKISQKEMDDLELNSMEFLMRNIIFSKETNDSYIEERSGIPIRMFADHKREILKLKKNKINE